MFRFLASLTLIGLVASAAAGQDGRPRTEAHENYVSKHAELTSAENGVGAQCDEDIALFTEHEETEPQGQAAYDAQQYKATAAGHKAAAAAILKSVNDRLNKPHPDNVPPALPGIGSEESVLGKAYELYAAGDDACIPLLNFAANLCALMTPQVMAHGDDEAWNRYYEDIAFTTWMNNQQGGSEDPPVMQ